MTAPARAISEYFVLYITSTATDVDLTTEGLVIDKTDDTNGLEYILDAAVTAETAIKFCTVDGTASLEMSTLNLDRNGDPDHAGSERAKVTGSAEVTGLQDAAETVFARILAFDGVRCNWYRIDESSGKVRKGVGLLAEVLYDATNGVPDKVTITGEAIGSDEDVWQGKTLLLETA